MVPYQKFNDSLVQGESLDLLNSTDLFFKNVYEALDIDCYYIYGLYPSNIIVKISSGIQTSFIWATITK